ncbi:hypothetical protein ABLE68_13565 [Nocardioides sp. CN2-186]|uniref:hypothetical protein n=1 Tax=Nocardioides tweenelious TaxID=3156607 RepID=UPI0032B53191
MRSRVLPLVLAAAFSSLLVGCDSGSDGPPGSSTEVVTLPDNLCDRLLSVVSPEWQLTESDHESSSDSSTATATCTLEGDRQGAVDLTATVTAFGTDDDATGALGDACDDINTSGGTTFKRYDDGCEATYSGPGEARGAYALPSDKAVLDLTMKSTGPFGAAVPAELAQVSLALVTEPLGS